ncbi:MAG: hypothetical protein PHO02_06620 [Candidatus Nanoarchaeia archaeon]|nr:hypothetical protein [Candidatus Nanoarchaeia archaeon]
MKMIRRPPREAKKSNKKMYVGLLGLMIIAIMVGSAADLWRGDEKEGAYEYKGLSFAQTDAGWVAYKPDNSQVWIMTNPAELENITIPYLNTAMLRTYGKLYVTYNPKERVRAALNQFFKNIPVPQLVVPACTVDVEECAELPLKNCTDAGNGVGVLLLREANETSVSFNNNCLVIEGKELAKIVDKIILESI